MDYNVPLTNSEVAAGSQEQVPFQRQRVREWFQGFISREARSLANRRAQLAQTLDGLLGINGAGGSVQDILGSTPSVTLEPHPNIQSTHAHLWRIGLHAEKDQRGQEPKAGMRLGYEAGQHAVSLGITRLASGDYGLEVDKGTAVRPLDELPSNVQGELLTVLETTINYLRPGVREQHYRVVPDA
jgi:hypothetical protein